MPTPELINANKFNDQRRSLCAFPVFDFKDVVRMYAIDPVNRNIILAWQGHFKVRKWFWPANGCFEVQTIAIDQFGKSNLVQQRQWELSSIEAQVLFIPSGYLNGFKALEESSRLLFFSDIDLQSSRADNIRFSLNDITWTEC